MNPAQILNRPKHNYHPVSDFVDRTKRAENDKRLWDRDAIDVSGFLKTVFPTASAYLKALKSYRVLDIGCGYGRYSPFLSRFDCIEYLGIDATESRIKYASEHYGNSVCRFEAGDARTIDGNNRFDLVLSYNVIQHLPLDDKLAVLKSIKRCVAPRGMALLYEARILEETLEQCAERYLDDACAAHMIPMPFELFARTLSPMCVHRQGLLFRVTWPQGEVK